MELEHPEIEKLLPVDQAREDGEKIGHFLSKVIL
jgi:hypothetical protein